jgi:geranylgeranyl diphosphate synthase type II
LTAPGSDRTANQNQEADWTESGTTASAAGETAGESLADYMRRQAARVEAAFDRLFPAHWAMPDRLREAMRYSLDAGGKRMRPILVLAAAEAFGGDSGAALPVACAVELVHTYSLIHDDLPAMDNDDFRRGKPTNHRVFGEAMAILAGDGLLTHAFHVIADSGLPAERALAIVRELSEYAGPRGMVGGQAADMLGEQGVTGLAELEYIHLHKTSDLIVFSLRAGARVAGADEAGLAAVSRFGENIGLAFQIQDDVLDVIGQESKLGKATQSDIKGMKVTYPFFLGVERSIEKVRTLTEEGKQALLSGHVPHPERLLELADYLMRRDH